MAVIHIDGKTVQVDGADNLLEACLSLGIDVPYFCYHPALGSVGSCRQCAVKQFNNAEDLEAGRGRLVMSCMVAPTDDMYISVDDSEAKAFRASVVEFLMTNHPHDCPTCPEGGHCHLQDMTYMSGHNQRRYRFTKRTHHNQDLGPFIKHEMNRCIACYRCVRYYKDYAGGDDLGVYASANRVYFGRETDGQFASEFSGNLTEVCPTGVFTDKTHAEHYNRKWDMQYAPSVCHGCSVGCNISPGERYGEIRRIENRYNGEVNGYFLCDLGRFGYGYINRDDRPTQPLERIGDKAVKINTDYALEEAVKRLKGKKVIGIGSPRASLETNFALKKLVGFDNFSTGLNQHQQTLVQTCIDVLKTEGVHNPSVKDIETHDAVLILGEDITQTSPIVALAVRQSAKNKAVQMADKLKTQDWLAEPVKRIGQNALSPVYVIDGVQTKLDDISKLSCVATPEDIAQLGFAIADAIKRIDAEADLEQLASAMQDVQGEALNDSSDNHWTADRENIDSETKQLAKQIAIDLLRANKPLVISGTSLFSTAIIEASAQINLALSDKRQAIYDAEQLRLGVNLEFEDTSISQKQAEQANHQPAEDKELNAKPIQQMGDEQSDDVREPAEPKLARLDENYQVSSSIYLCVPDVNSIGVCLLGGHPVETVLAKEFDAVVVAENQLTDAISVEKLANLLNDKKVIALDHQYLHWHDYVGLVLPSASFAEADGTLISSEGRAQRFFQVYDPTYYHPNSDIRDGWRWLHALQNAVHDEPLAWIQLDDVMGELVSTHPQLQRIVDAAPSADFRISGLKIAREPRRYSGRTAMRAPLSIHEPMQPKDMDSGLTFSMEGYQGKQTPSSMIPFAWSAGWNSPQAWNKYQDKVGGHLKQGDPGVRLFDALSDGALGDNQRLPKRDYIAPEKSVVQKSSLFEGRAKLIPIYDLFAKSPMGSRSPVVESQLPEPAYYVSEEDALSWQLSAKDWLAVSIDGLRIELPVKIVPHLAAGCIGYPVGQVPIIHPNMPTAVAKIDPPVTQIAQLEQTDQIKKTDASADVSDSATQEGV